MVVRVVWFVRFSFKVRRLRTLMNPYQIACKSGRKPLAGSFIKRSALKIGTLRTYLLSAIRAIYRDLQISTTVPAALLRKMDAITYGIVARKDDENVIAGKFKSFEDPEEYFVQYFNYAMQKIPSTHPQCSNNCAKE